MANINIKNPRFHRGPSLADQVAEYLTGEIKRGAYSPGDSLPSEAILAKKFSVSRTVIREALARLKYDGQLESKQGVGARVASPGEVRSFRFEIEDLQNDEYLKHLYELRAILEGDATALAAERRSDQHLGKLARHLGEMERVLKEGGDGSESDTSFHQCVVEAAGNPFLLDFFVFLENRLRGMIRRARDKVSKDPHIPSLVQEEHTSIFLCIRDSDPIKARQAALKHLGNSLQRQGIKSSHYLRLDWSAQSDIK